MRNALIMAGFVAFFALLLAAAVVARRRGLHGEWTRKAMHIGMGLATLPFPWLFSETWPVLALTGGFIVVMLALRFIPAVGGVVGGVARWSFGEIYFPVAVGGLFVLTDGNKAAYIIPLLVLTLADAAAALVGVFAGRHHYSASEGVKSWEGTAAFCVTAFACVFVPLVWTGKPPERAALTAACVAVIGALIEASAWRGVDNLLLPFATLLMVHIYDALPLPDLVLRLSVLGLLGVVFLALRKHSLLSEGTMLGVLLTIYLCWVFGGPRWMIAPGTLLVVHRALAHWRPRDATLAAQGHHALLGLTIPPLGWLFAERLTGGVNGFAPFCLAVTVHLALTALALWRSDRRGGWLLVPLAALVGVALVGWPWWMLDSTHSARLALSGTVALLVASALFHLLLPRIGGGPPFAHWFCRGALAAVASFFAWL
jgi:phytol kinase